VGIFGICAEAQQPVDQAIKDWGLHFQVCVPDYVCVFVFGKGCWGRYCIWQSNQGI